MTEFFVARVHQAPLSWTRAVLISSTLTTLISVAVYTILTGWLIAVVRYYAEGYHSSFTAFWNEEYYGADAGVGMMVLFPILSSIIAIYFAKRYLAESSTPNRSRIRIYALYIVLVNTVLGFGYSFAAFYVYMKCCFYFSMM